jgi:hypothetical protein
LTEPGGALHVLVVEDSETDAKLVVRALPFPQKPITPEKLTRKVRKVLDR